ncbi:hypothetical protein HEP74_00538 [Xanthomonas sp. SS]|uniref:hypothetical protein n=1 Tax=Xanthomonas sp. SS TaxID=2724122 RepID=UPI0016394FD5|nr:hypothetical protein [Xanthomonas sp. SS]QNH15416.1 hypothetical protein HEP74_00538 [Xanthomonas sp. SS]
MTNVVIASQDPLAQSLQTLLIDQQGFVAGPPLDALQSRTVIASSTDVYGQWGPHGYGFQGNVVTLAPNPDPTNLFDQMSLAD